MIPEVGKMTVFDYIVIQLRFGRKTCLKVRANLARWEWLHNRWRSRVFRRLNEEHKREVSGWRDKASQEHDKRLELAQSIVPIRLVSSFIHEPYRDIAERAAIIIGTIEQQSWRFAIKYAVDEAKKEAAVAQLCDDLQAVVLPKILRKLCEDVIEQYEPTGFCGAGETTVLDS